MFLKYLLLLILKLLFVVGDDENIEIVVDTTGNETEGDITMFSSWSNYYITLYFQKKVSETWNLLNCKKSKYL